MNFIFFCEKKTVSSSSKPKMTQYDFKKDLDIVNNYLENDSRSDEAWMACYHLCYKGYKDDVFNLIEKFPQINPKKITLLHKAINCNDKRIERVNQMSLTMDPSVKKLILKLTCGSKSHKK